ncbi:MAG: polysaccharide deacetylase family protein [Candidatus Cryptobacteroides sp.]
MNGILVITLSVLVAAALIFLVWSCSRIGSGVWIKARCRDIRDGKVVLTFDDGPDPEVTPKVLDVLDRYGVKAYFFVIGSKAEKHPELIRLIVSRGHTVGNHTYTHSPLFPISGKSFIEDDVRACDSVIDLALQETCGSPSASPGPRLFRPPFGVTNPDIAKILKHTAHEVIGWDVRSFDTVHLKDSLAASEVDSAIERCVGRILRKARPGSVILLHDRLANAPALLSRLIPALRRSGLDL